MTTNPLNIALYRALQRFQGGVRTSNAGQRRVPHYMPDPRDPSRVRCGKPKQSGEQYRINCPFCGDRRRRLEVSYQYGKYDPSLQRANYNLWFCHNDTHCHEDPANRSQFRNLVSVPRRLSRQSVRDSHDARDDSIAFDPQPRPIELPDDAARVDCLPFDHPAAVYLRGRNLDLTELSNVWGVRFVSQWSQSRAAGRILIPVERPAALYTPADASTGGQRILAGWQARTVNDIPGAPKYLFPSGFAKSSVLYGLCQAKETTGPVAVVEGAADVWRAGAGAVATFGSRSSREQILLLRHHFTGRPVVFLPDEDAIDSAATVANDLLAARSQEPSGPGVFVASLPQGRNDPADCTQEELWDAVVDALPDSYVQNQTMLEGNHG